jgi:pimeloyl-ACP methyl ester carboxylesterase
MRISLLFALLALFAGVALADDSSRLVRVDHYVPVRSMAPQITGQTAEIYVREVVKAGIGLRAPASADPVVLFVHGAGTPAEVAFDVPYQDYSWMAYVAGAGFDVFGMDVTGYGRSTRPPAMNEPCNLTKEQQLTFAPGLIAAPCSPAYAKHATTIESDWNDIDAVVDYLRALRHVGRVNLVGWSLGGPRTGGYTAHHPEKAAKLVLLAPAYNRASGTAKPEEVPARGTAFNTQSHSEFLANWDRQTGCPAQYDPAVADSVWSSMLQSDAVGATWGTGVRRAPQVTTWGWSRDVVSKVTTPVLAVSGAYDKQVQPQRVSELIQDLGSSAKVFADLACSSHNALWEKNHPLLFDASVQWLTKGSLNGASQGNARLGYAPAP